VGIKGRFNLTKPYKSETRNLILFFIVACVFTWMFWIPEALATRGMLGSSFLLGPNNPAAWGPLIAAFSLTLLYDGVDGVTTLLKRAGNVRFAKAWWIPIILLFPAINGGALLLAKLSGEAIPELFWLTSPTMIVVYFVQYLLTGGPLLEEFGWRGYALPRLQTRFNALVSSIILGVMWWLWHIPYFWIGEEVIYQHIFLGMLPSNILFSILLTWLYNNTGGSILVSLIFHNMFIMANVLFPALETQIGSLFYLVFIIAATIAVIVIWGSKKLVRASER
jgi:membrane protease YdiL (CAAX protease family)